MPTSTTKTAPTKKTSTLRARMEKAGPRRTKLRKLVRANRPPQAWYDATDCPFKPAKH